ncbi:MAG TPA: LysR family transcriptional regulator ArgP [Ideonella sp.]|uniref:LysR family transcriptional regulator ArgP n=1 Tax=Ideonella sp. TaxID=1929293 RepID=UPI002E33E1A3|nr:LysR family transcriptional regulator ArgP [Ideonella sp.]HEX5682490.1 LysR family transcriptional regulator ArgP [Ideonella sp.]
MLDYALIDALAAVLREGSFERAARALHLTPSAVSQRVRLLEERLGQVLVVRSNPTRATPAGRALARHAEQVGLLEHELLGELPVLAQGVQGRVTLPVAVNADSLASWFIAAAAEATADAPLLLDLSLDDQEHTAEWLRSGEVVAAVTALAQAVPGCRSVPLGRLRYCATASPAFMQHHFADGVDAGSLAQAPTLTFNRRDRLQDQWIDQVLGHDQPAPTHWLPSTQAFVDGCLAGLGWGMNMQAMVQPMLDRGELVELVPGQTLAVPLYWQHRRRSPMVLEALSRAVQKAAAAVLEPLDEPVR